MIPNAKLREVETGGVTASSAFGISHPDSAHLMTILRDTLYSDKVLAVIREYSSNAWDAHREVGKDTIPIKVTIPTQMKPTLEIQDFGPGLSHEAVFTVYTQYGASTKRNNDRAVGMLGIGSKSGFAYSDSFTITSCHGGVKRMYVAVLDPSEKGAINLLFEQPCGEETGVAIQIAVKQEDIREFTETAKRFFQYFLPRPDTNIELPPAPTERLRLVNGLIYDDGTVPQGNWVAVMGCVPYHVNLEQLTAEKNNGMGVASFIRKISGALYFGIGGVHISASREELKYNAETKRVLIEKFNALVDEYVEHAIDNLEKGGFTPWEKRVRSQVLRHLDLPLPGAYKELTQSFVLIKPEPTKFIITKLSYGKKNKTVHNTAATVSIDEKSRILLRDDDRALTGYDIDHAHDYIVKPLGSATLDEAKVELLAILKDMGLEGMPMVQMSTLTWNAAAKPDDTGPSKNKKHTVSSFVLQPTGKTLYFPWSQYWEIVERVPEPEDLFVLLRSFRDPDSTVDLYSLYREDEVIATNFKFKMPTVYGYKTTEKKPVFAKDCIGTNYLEWREKLPQLVIDSNEEVAKQFDTWEWAQPMVQFNYHISNGIEKDTLRRLAKALGPKHIICQHLFKIKVASTRVKKWGWDKKQALEGLYDRLYGKNAKHTKITDCKTSDASIKTTYPLIDACGIAVLWGSNSEQWLDYVKMVDRERAVNP